LLGREVVTKEEAKKWWMAGFYESGEGWNGEYPFNHPVSPERREAISKMLDGAFEEDWELTKAAENIDPNDPTLVPWE